ncbi:hypothetical protein [Empedobacter falsenii]|uniref:hypothetical protein n=1 Tax=Empedobacter falsenii TaxID=343874 RepID=UPI003A7FF8BF
MKITIVDDELLAVTYLKNLLEKKSIIDVSSITILRTTKKARLFLKKIRLILFLWILIWEMEKVSKCFKKLRY